MTTEKFTPVIKVDSDRNLVFGWAYVALDEAGMQVIDHSGEMVDLEELEDAAYLFNLVFRDTGVMHEGEAVGKLVESLVVTPDKIAKLGLPVGSLPMGWWVGFFIEDDAIFAKVKSGEYQAFSIQGKAVREEVETGHE